MYNFTQITNLDLNRVKTFCNLMNLCEKNHINITKVEIFLNGFIIHFEDYPGDAILHDFSIGKENYLWETIDFPWDYGDVSTHSTNTLVELLWNFKYNN